MNDTREKIILLESDATISDGLQAALHAAGHEVSCFSASAEMLEAALQSAADLLVLDCPAVTAETRELLATIRGAESTAAARVILLVGAESWERTAALEYGADDAISRPCDHAELFARIRNQLHVKKAEDALRHEAQIAQEGQQIAHTAFEALAVTEKMTSDAFSLDRRLKIGLASFFALAVLMAGTYFLFARSTQKQDQRTTKLITGLERGIIRQQDLLAEIRKLRASQGSQEAPLATKDDLKKKAEDLKSRIATADPSTNDLSALRSQLAETNARLQRVEQERGSAETLIPADVQSVCLLHVSVAFRNQQSGQRLRYAGLNPQGEPIQDSSGNPIITLDGHGPEVKMDVFGTGFLAGPDGRVITNRHVAEPWWKNDDLDFLGGEGVQAEISDNSRLFSR